MSEAIGNNQQKFRIRISDVDSNGAITVEVDFKNVIKKFLMQKDDVMEIQLADNVFLAGVSLAHNNPEFLCQESQLSDSQEKQE